MKWKRKVKQVFAMMLAVATLLSGCAPNGIVFRWGYTCDYTQQGGTGNPFFMRFLSTVLGSSPVYRFFDATESHKMWGSAVFVFLNPTDRRRQYKCSAVIPFLASPYLHWAVSLECILPERWSEPPAHS